MNLKAWQGKHFLHKQAVLNAHLLCLVWRQWWIPCFVEHQIRILIEGLLHKKAAGFWSLGLLIPKCFSNHHINFWFAKYKHQHFLLCGRWTHASSQINVRSTQPLCSCKALKVLYTALEADRWSCLVQYCILCLVATFWQMIFFLTVLLENTLLTGKTKGDSFVIAKHMYYHWVMELIQVWKGVVRQRTVQGSHTGGVVILPHPRQAASL